MGRKNNLLIFVAVLLFSLLTVSSCGKEDEVRKYKEPASENTRARVTEKETEKPAIPLWGVPGNWSVVKSKSSLRLATYNTPLQSVCSIIMIPGEAGTINANISRWLRQLKKEDTKENIESIIKGAEEFSTIGRLKGKLYDFSSLSAPEETSFLIAIVNTGDSRMFIKLKGKPESLKKERTDLITFCQSITNE